MPVADHDHMLSGETRGVLDRGHPVLNEPRLGGGSFPERGETVGTDRTRGAPGARRVDHGACFDPHLRAIGAADVHDERLSGPPGIDREIPALSPDPDDPRPVLDAITERLRERREIPLDPLRPGRVPLGRRHPSGGLQQATRRRIGELCPR